MKSKSQGIADVPIETKSLEAPTPDFKACSLAGDFGASLMYFIHHLYIGVQKRLESVLAAKKEISFSQFVILTGFSCKEYPKLTQAKLAEHLMLTEATISRHISILVSKKLLHKEKDAVNKKSYNLTLTPLGTKTYTRAQIIINKELETHFKNIAPPHQKIIIDNFTKIITSLQQKK